MTQTTCWGCYAAPLPQWLEDVVFPLPELKFLTPRTEFFPDVVKLLQSIFWDHTWLWVFLCHLFVVSSSSLFQIFDPFQPQVSAKRGERITPSISQRGNSLLVFVFCFLYDNLKTSTKLNVPGNSNALIYILVFNIYWAEKLCLWTIINKLTGQVVCQVHPHTIQTFPLLLAFVLKRERKENLESSEDAYGTKLLFNISTDPDVPEL